MRRLIRVATFIAFSLPALLMAGDDLAVVVNKSNPVDNLSKSALKKLVLGEEATWPSGSRVNVILRSPGQPERDGALRSICGMSENDFNQELLHASLNGETRAVPKALSSAIAVRQLVMSIPGAIGFLRMADVNGTVKVITVDGVAAGQPAYKVKEGK